MIFFGYCLLGLDDKSSIKGGSEICHWWWRYMPKVLHTTKQHLMYMLQGVLKRWRFNTLRLGQNGCHFPDKIFKCIFLNESVWISIRMSLEFVPKVPRNNIPALVQIMAWCLQATSHYLNQWWPSLPTHICITRPQWVKQSLLPEYYYFP